MSTMPGSPHSVAFFPYLFRFWDGNYIANDLMTRYDGEAVSEECLLDCGVRVADTDGQNFDQNLEQKMPIMSI
jgi:hypothetical protein